MIDLVVRSFLGRGGSALLDYYLQYSLVINGIILLYLVLFLLSRKTYTTTLTFLIHTITDAPEVRGKEGKQIRSLLKKMEMPWDEALKVSMFPLITASGGWLIYPKTKTRIIKIFSLEVLQKNFEGKKTKPTEGS